MNIFLHFYHKPNSKHDAVGISQLKKKQAWTDACANGMPVENNGKSEREGERRKEKEMECEIKRNA